MSLKSLGDELPRIKKSKSRRKDADNKAPSTPKVFSPHRKVAIRLRKRSSSTIEDLDSLASTGTSSTRSSSMEFHTPVRRTVSRRALLSPEAVRTLTTRSNNKISSPPRSLLSPDHSRKFVAQRRRSKKGGGLDSFFAEYDSIIEPGTDSKSVTGW